MKSRHIVQIREMLIDKVKESYIADEIVDMVLNMERREQDKTMIAFIYDDYYKGSDDQKEEIMKYYEMTQNERKNYQDEHVDQFVVLEQLIQEIRQQNEVFNQQNEELQNNHYEMIQQEEYNNWINQYMVFRILKKVVRWLVGS